MECHEVGQRVEHGSLGRRVDVSDDQCAAPSGRDQLVGAEQPILRIEAHLGQFAQRGQRCLAVVVLERLGVVGEKDGGHDAAPLPPAFRV